MNIFWSFFMGIVQGITEFFPVSSSGHLTMLPFLFKYKDPGLSFSIALHTGTLVAIIWVFRRDWQKILIGSIKGNKTQTKLLLLLALTSIPGALAGLFFESLAETAFRNPAIVAFNLIIFGMILYYIDKKFTDRNEIKKMNYTNALVIGFSQALAIVPGVSRSGATITAARFIGLKRAEALRYSFLAAAPIILGATIFGLRNIDLSNLFSLNWIFGFSSALFASVWAMKFLLKYSKTNDFKIFLWWRIILATVIIILVILRG